MQYSIDINGSKAIVKYRRYRFLHNKIFIGFTALWIAVTLICILSILEFGIQNIYVTIFLDLVSYLIPFRLWSIYVDRRNKRTEESMAQGGLSVAGGCRCLTKDGNTSIEKEGYIPYPLQA